MTYFLSDAHLGSRAITNPEAHQQTIITMLNNMAKDATAIYLLGDIFDFWCEYFWRDRSKEQYLPILNTLKSLTNKGIQVHFFIGNHDLWCKKYLTEECGIIMHYEPMTLDIEGKLFYLAHGDGLGDPDRKFRFLRGMFHNPVLQWLFAGLPPRWGLEFGLEWAKHSRFKHEKEGAPRYMGEQNEPLIVYSKEYLKKHPDINYFIYGHRHIELDLMLTRDARLLILGEWVDLCTYAVFDGDTLRMENFIEGETQP